MTPNEPRQWERESSTPWCISKGSAVCILFLSLCVLALSGWSYLSYQRMNELDARMVELGLSKRVNVEQKTTPPILQRVNEATIHPDEVIEEEPPPPTEKRREAPLIAVPDKKQPVAPVVEKRREAPLVAVPDKKQPVAPVVEKRREVPLVAAPDKKQPVVSVVEKPLVSPAFIQFKRQCLLQGGGTVEVAEGVEWVCPEKREPYKEQPVVSVVEKRREAPLVAVSVKQPVVSVAEKSFSQPAFIQFKRQCLLQGGGTAEVAEGVEWVCPEKWEP